MSEKGTMAHAAGAGTPASTGGSASGSNPSAHQQGVMALGLAALGIVFGDIGTSPLYTLQTVLTLAGPASHGEVLGVLSLLVWTLFVITTVKYVMVAMRIDNDGEGGILALMSLLGIKRHQRPMLVAVGLFGAALIYGDGAITPAISVLSALEGLNIAWPSVSHYVLPAAVLILFLLFLVQPLGTARIGNAFGPIMMIWFLCIGALGAWGVAKHPGVLLALNPVYALGFLRGHGAGSFVVLGGVFLCVTGAEALYADMGHFGPKPIRMAWGSVVLPCLVLNYAGQSALVLSGAPTGDNIFYRLCPESLLLPLIVLATIATIIASQSIITGAFSMTRQAIQLGWLPRLKITQTSALGYGQIYVGFVNWLLMLVTIWLALFFGKSDRLAAAYGIAVSATMLMTSVLLTMAMREIWNWNWIASVLVGGVFFFIDAAFFSANMLKFTEGGYVPLLLAVLVYGVMFLWHHGTVAIALTVNESPLPVSDFMAQLAASNVPRVPGSAVFLTRARQGVPPVMRWNVQQNRSLRRYVLVINASTVAVPWVADADRLSVQQEALDYWRVAARFGFMERPDIPALLQRLAQVGCNFPVDDVTYYVGHETIVSREDGKGMPRWQQRFFALLKRNAMQISDYFYLPADRVVEIGRQVPI